jgi:3-oxoacyl-[acyl-carrier protein] reductase
MLKNQTAIVTGASRGIGRAIALSLAREGMNIILASRTKSSLDSVADEVSRSGGNPVVIATDVSHVQAVDNLVEKALDSFGKIDVLINNAGIGMFAPVEDIQVSDFDKMFNVNMRGVFLCTRAVLPHMKKRRSGAIINISSLAGKNFFKGGSGYAATKWALNGFTKCLMLEAREFNIRVSVICPGSVATEFTSDTSKDASKILQARDVADAVLTVLRLPAHALMSEVDLRPTNPK